MTTPQAAAIYLMQHQKETNGQPNVIYNPDNLPETDLPVIYGFNNGGSDSWYHAQLLAQDGTAMGSHICSHEAYMPSDLAIIEGGNPPRHDDFQKHYPHGYRMEFVSNFKGFEAEDCHAGLKAAFDLNQKMRPAPEGNEAKVEITYTDAA